MAEAKLFISEKLKVDWPSVLKFMQRMIFRLAQGHAQYGPPERRKNYMTRIEKEINAYKKSGNCELLYNIANYCWLESQAPQNKKFHYDQTVGSVTRDGRKTLLRRGFFVED